MPEAAPELCTPREVADLMRVDVKTVAQWVKKGLIRSLRTPGGHNRYVGADIDAVMHGQQPAHTSTPPDQKEDTTG